ncbi:MAG: chemotaxis protein, partial [Luteibacter sp.]
MSAIRNWFGRTRLNTRVWMVMTVVVLGLAAQTVMSGVESRGVQMRELEDTLADHVNAAVSIVDAYHARAEKG